LWVLLSQLMLMTTKLLKEIICLDDATALQDDLWNRRPVLPEGVRQSSIPTVWKTKS
jgi:hypothetical protein